MLHRKKGAQTVLFQPQARAVAGKATSANNSVSGPAGGWAALKVDQS
jgi:hypothetical protein